MEKNIIRINESQLKKIISESVKKAIREMINGKIPYFYISLMKNGERYNEEYRDMTREEIKQAIMEKHPKFSEEIIEKWLNTPERYIDPNPPKKKSSTTPRQKIGKPEGMSDVEYINKFAPEHNEKLAKKISEVEGEEWKPVQNIGRYFGGAVDFSCDYSVSNKGRLKVVNFKDVNKSDIYTGYPAPTRGAMQFHLNGFDDEGNSMKTCPDVKYIVADAWLEPHDMKQFMVIHKDGDYKNNNVENLEWVPRKRK